MSRSQLTCPRNTRLLSLASKGRLGCFRLRGQLSALRSLSAVSLIFMASGVVDDYDAAAVRSLEESLAAIAGVALEDITVVIQLASVRIESAIRVTDAARGAALSSAPSDS